MSTVSLEQERFDYTASRAFQDTVRKGKSAARSYDRRLQFANIFTLGLGLFARCFLLALLLDRLRINRFHKFDGMSNKNPRVIHIS